MPARPAAPGAPTDPAALREARAASIRRWTWALTVVFVVLTAVRLAHVLRTPAPQRDWEDVTLPASLVVLYLAIPRKHQRALYRGLMTVSFALLGATLWMLLQGSGEARSAPANAAAAQRTPAR